MSVEEAREFFRLIAVDEDIQERIHDEVASAGHQGIFVLIRLAAESGFDFSVDDYTAAVREIATDANMDPGELRKFGPPREEAGG